MGIKRLVINLLLVLPFVATACDPVRIEKTACKPEEYVYVATSPLINHYLTKVGSAAEQAGRDLGRKVVWLSTSYYDLSKQIDNTESAISFRCIKGLSAIAADSQSLKAVMDEATRRGIATAQTGACPEENVAAICFATSYKGIGETVAEKLAKITSGKCNVVIARGPIGDANEQSRIDGFTDFVTKNLSNIKISDTLANCGTLEGTTGCAERALVTHPEMNVYWAIISNAALGAAASFGQAGRNDIVVIGADDDPEILAAIRKGTIAFSFSQQPFGQGYLMVYLPYLMAEKGLKPTSKFLDLGLTVIDRSNIDTYESDVKSKWQKLRDYVDAEFMKP
jgi:ribose transport system substrate-binding protein